MTSSSVRTTVCLILVAALILQLAGCQLPADRAIADQAGLSIGMHETQVLDSLGSPDDVFPDSSGEMWKYRYTVGNGWWFLGRAGSVLLAISLLPVLLFFLVLMSSGGGGSRTMSPGPRDGSPPSAPRHNPLPDSFFERNKVSFRLHLDQQGRVDWIAPVERERNRYKSPESLALEPQRHSRVTEGQTRDRVVGILGEGPRALVEHPGGVMWLFEQGDESFRIQFDSDWIVEWVSPIEER